MEWPQRGQVTLSIPCYDSLLLVVHEVDHTHLLFCLIIIIVFLNKFSLLNNRSEKMYGMNQ